LLNNITLNSSEKSQFGCEFCSRTFTRETSFLKHVCEQKRRHLQKHEPAVQLGLRAFQEFHRLGLNKTREITYQEFSRSAFYLAFVRFGRYLREVGAIDTLSYTRWLIKNNVKIDSWASDKIYTSWLRKFLLNEQPHDALIRSIKTMTAWAEENNAAFSDFFRYGNENKVIWKITTGEISAWSIYCSESGRQFLERLNAEQLSLILDYVNPEFWMKKINQNSEESSWIKQTLTNTGL